MQTHNHAIENMACFYNNIAKHARQKTLTRPIIGAQHNDDGQKPGGPSCSVWAHNRAKLECFLSQMTWGAAVIWISVFCRHWWMEGEDMGEQATGVTGLGLGGTKEFYYIQSLPTPFLASVCLTDRLLADWVREMRDRAHHTLCGLGAVFSSYNMAAAVLVLPF